MNNIHNPDPTSAQLRRELQARQKREAEDAARRLLSGNGADPVQEAKRVQAYDAILSTLDSGHKLEKWVAVAVGLTCVVIVGVLYSIPRSASKVLLTIESEAVSLRLAAPLSWPAEMSMSPPLQIKGLNTLDSLLFAQSLQSPHGDVWLRVDRGDASLSELTLTENGVVEIDTEPGRRNFYFNEAPISGSLLVAGRARLQAGTKTDAAEYSVEQQLMGPESLDFSAKGQGAVSTMLALDAEQPLTLYNIPIKGMGFAREVRSGVTTTQFVSTISSGSISLPEVKEQISLRSGERLMFSVVAGRITQLDVGKHIKLQFEGVVEGIQLGPQGFEREVEPSWLSYLYHQEKLAFVWSAFLFVWGILWSIRKTVFG